MANDYFEIPDAFGNPLAIRSYKGDGGTGTGVNGPHMGLVGSCANEDSVASPNTLSTRERPPTSLLTDKVSVTTPGTEVRLASSSTPVRGVSVKARAGNTGLVFIGPSGVSSSNGYELSAGESVEFLFTDLHDIWIDAANGGEGVTYLAVMGW